MRLACGVVYLGNALRHDRRHEYVFRRRDAGFVEKYLGALKGTAEPDRLLADYRLGAQSHEPGEMRIEAAMAYRVAAGRRKRGAAETREQRTGEKEAGPYLCGEIVRDR